jgi:transcription elongation factor GreB
MSKAFLRESDDSADASDVGPAPLRDAGAKDYLTTDGARRLEAELKYLRTDSRPPLVAHLNEADAKRELQRVDQRIRHLERTLAAAEIIPMPADPPPSVQFGATVTVRDPAGASERYRIVGADETDAANGWISFRSPLAQALLGARPGQHVSFNTPRGPAEIEIIAVHYEPEPAESEQA